MEGYVTGVRRGHLGVCCASPSGHIQTLSLPQAGSVRGIEGWRARRTSRAMATADLAYVVNRQLDCSYPWHRMGHIYSKDNVCKFLANAIPSNYSRELTLNKVRGTFNTF